MAIYGTELHYRSSVNEHIYEEVSRFILCVNKKSIGKTFLSLHIRTQCDTHCTVCVKSCTWKMLLTKVLIFPLLLRMFQGSSYSGHDLVSISLGQSFHFHMNAICSSPTAISASRMLWSWISYAGFIGLGCVIVILLNWLVLLTIVWSDLFCCSLIFFYIIKSWKNNTCIW